MSIPPTMMTDESTKLTHAPVPSSAPSFPKLSAPYTKPFWRTQPNKLDEFQSTPELPETCDVLIVGGGYAGISTAYHLVSGRDEEGKETGRKFEGSVVLCEARQACSGATGRNGGHLRPSWNEIPKYISRHGLEAATEVLDFEWRHLPVLRKLIRDNHIDCDFWLTRCIVGYYEDEDVVKAKESYDMLVEYGLEGVQDWAYEEGKAAEGWSGLKGAKAVLHSTSGVIWPYKLMLWLLNRAVENGVELHTSTPVESVASEKDADGYIAVKTARGTIRARKVIHASNAYASGLLPEYKESIIPCKGICCHIVVPEGSTAPVLTASYGTKMANGEGAYLVPLKDGSLIVGGGYEHRKNLNSWFDNTDDSTLIEESRHYYDDYMQRTFRGWEDSKAEVKEIWTGVMGYSADTLPHIGAVPSKQDQYIVAGFNGHGMPVIYLSAYSIAQMIIEDKPFEQTGVPRLFKTTQERLEKNRNGKYGGDILGWTESLE